MPKRDKKSKKKHKSEKDEYEDKFKKEQREHKKEERRKLEESLINSLKLDFQTQNIDARLALAKERQNNKKLSKDLETHEEKQARRMAKRTAKRERELAANTGMNVVKKSFILYEEGDNPFNDERLKETFLWKKKFEAEGLDHLSKSESKLVVEERQKKLQEEVYNARVARHHRELERALHEQEIEELQREREAMHYNEWIKKEDQFQLKQIRTRSKLRIENNRGQPIDFLSRYIYATERIVKMHKDAIASDDEEEDGNSQDDDLAGYDGPLTIIRTTVKSVQDLEDILDDVIVYKKLVKKQKSKIVEDLKILRRKLEQGSNGVWPDLSDHVDAETIKAHETKLKDKVEHYMRKSCIYSRHLDFWNDIEVIITENLKENEKCDIFRAADQRRAINTSVYTKVNNMFENKSADQLTKLKLSIKTKIENGGPGVDIPYWEGLLQQLHSFEAKARLTERHQEHLKVKFGHIETEEQKLAADLEVMKHRMTTMASHQTENETTTEKELRRQLEKERKEKACKSMYKKRAYSPDRITKGIDDKQYPMQRMLATLGEKHQEIDIIIADSFWEVANPTKEQYTRNEADKAEFIKKQKKVSQQNTKDNKATLDSNDPNRKSDEALPEALRKIKNETNQSGALAFGDEVTSDLPIKYDWQDRWRPRKPKYFNRVNTGFEWNRYNQTHYDYETPPPKVVTGYKFNIYYPDLIDKRAIPTYNLYADNTNPEYSIMVFTAGPPYEDLAFRVVNKKMDTLERHGFMCEFRGGVFRLHFTYKRSKYKR